MKSILVTGGCGFIGSNLINYLIRECTDVKIVNLDALTYAGNKSNIEIINRKDNYHFIQGDICNARLVAKIFEKYQIDTVIHLAAETHVDRSITKPLQFVRTNVDGTAVLLDAARNYWNNDRSGQVRFHHVSTDEVFGTLSPTDDPFSEFSQYSPNSPYSASKAASDHLVRAYFRTYQMPISISNCSNNFGPYQYPEKLIPLVIMNCLEGKPIPVYGDGKQIRDWLFVEDHCSALLHVLTKGKIGETYLIGGNNQPTNIELIQRITAEMDKLMQKGKESSYSKLITYVKDRPGHDRRYDLDTSKIKNELHWEPSYSLQDGLLKTITWYINNRKWIESIKQKKEFSAWMQKNYQSRGENK